MSAGLSLEGALDLFRHHIALVIDRDLNLDAV
jgi:hypothetical protein